MATKAKVTYPKRGEVYVVNFDPTLGAEIWKTRPALVIQNNIASRHSRITIVPAITPQVEQPLYPTEVLIQAPEGGLKKDSVVLLNHVRSVDKRRLVRRLGTLRLETIEHVNQALSTSLGLANL